jgi:hypothetical protein
MLSHLLFKDKLTILFCLLDDFLALLPKPNQALVSGKIQRVTRPTLPPRKSSPWPYSVSGLIWAIGKPSMT